MHLPLPTPEEVREAYREGEDAVLRFIITFLMKVKQKVSGTFRTEDYSYLEIIN